VCKEHYTEGNEMRDEMLTLQEYGIDGAPEGAKEIVRNIYVNL